MAQRVEYGKPRRLNAVSFAFILLLCAGGYWMWRFFPSYFNAWTVDHILAESASEVYRVNRYGEPDRTNGLHSIIDKAKADIANKADVHDPDLVVGLNIDGDKATVTADYRVVVTHPYLSRTTTLHFQRSETADIKAVNWGN